MVNSDVQYTSKYKKIKSDLITNYIKHLKNGKIRTKDTKYVTLFSNPYEMLLASIGMYKGKSIMKGREIYCPYYNDGQEFCASRNPHINAGNVMYTKNKYHEEYTKWFNFTENICAINFFDNDKTDDKWLVFVTNKDDAKKILNSIEDSRFICSESCEYKNLMNKDTLNKIGEAFYTTKTTGTGLGVKLSKEIIEAHNGSIEYKSKPKIGTSVTITLPLKKSLS
jgi:hypothetical protein